MNMAIIVVDRAYLQTSSPALKSQPLQRFKKQLAGMLFGRNKRNRSPFPDRVWARHSALLNAARLNTREKSNG
jgi:hypothetical protein